jgi:hypothetical protein
MPKQFEVRFEGELPATPQEVWDAFTTYTRGWYWEIDYEPRLGGKESGLTAAGGTVTAWDPPRHFLRAARRTTVGGTTSTTSWRTVMAARSCVSGERTEVDIRCPAQASDLAATQPV